MIFRFWSLKTVICGEAVRPGRMLCSQLGRHPFKLGDSCGGATSYREKINDKITISILPIITNVYLFGFPKMYFPTRPWLTGRICNSVLSYGTQRDTKSDGLDRTREWKYENKISSPMCEKW